MDVIEGQQALQHEFPVSEMLPKWIPDRLRYPQSVWLTLIVAPILTLGIGSLLSYLVQLAAPGLAGPEFPDAHWLVTFTSIVIVSPVLETFFMAGVYALSRRFTGVGGSIIVTTIICAICHSLLAPAWGLVIWWPFMVFTTIYAIWRQVSFGAGLAMGMAAHALNNLPPTIALILAHTGAIAS